VGLLHSIPSYSEVRFVTRRQRPSSGASGKDRPLDCREGLRNHERRVLDVWFGGMVLAMNTMVPSHTPVLVASAIIHEGERFLISRRLPDAKIEAGKWEFPGGKVEFGEHPEDCLQREIREELNLDIEIESFYQVVSHIYSLSPKPTHIVLLCYLARVTSGELKFLEVAEAKWIDRAEFRNYDFAVADIPVVDRLLGKV